MGTVEITLPVNRAAAERLRAPPERARLGVLVSLADEGLVGPAGVTEATALTRASTEGRRTALRDAFGDTRRAAAAAGITVEEVE